MNAAVQPVAGARTGAQGWQARLNLAFAWRQGRTVLAHREHFGPLMVQSPFRGADEVCQVCVLHPPGGVVAGDELAISVSAAEGAHALLTAPAATKFYRSLGGLARAEQSFKVAEGATLEWVPQENLIFDRARVRLDTRVELTSGARFLGWDIQCLGRPVGGEDFERGSVYQGLSVFLDGQPLLLERTLLEAGSETLAAPWGWRDRRAWMTALVYPANEALVERLRKVIEPFGPNQGAVTELDGLAIVRLLANEAREIRRYWAPLWRCARAHLKPGASFMSEPRIWST